MCQVIDQTCIIDSAISGKHDIVIRNISRFDLFHMNLTCCLGNDVFRNLDDDSTQERKHRLFQSVCPFRCCRQTELVSAAKVCQNLVELHHIRWTPHTFMAFIDHHDIERIPVFSQIQSAHCLHSSECDRSHVDFAICNRAETGRRNIVAGLRPVHALIQQVLSMRQPKASASDSVHKFKCCLGLAASTGHHDDSVLAL